MAPQTTFTYRRHNHYNTRSNQWRCLRTPGNKLVRHYVKKRVGVRLCGDTKQPLHGIPALRNFEVKKLGVNQRTVSRAYGGHLSHSAVRDRILRAFLREEHKCVKAVYLEKERQMKEAAKKEKAAAKGSKKKLPTAKRN